jgi:hypothetical protein
MSAFAVICWWWWRARAKGERDRKCEVLIEVLFNPFFGKAAFSDIYTQKGGQISVRFSTIDQRAE